MNMTVAKLRQMASADKLSVVDKDGRHLPKMKLAKAMLTAAAGGWSVASG